MNLAEIRLARIIYKLAWSANSEWSASVTPEECGLLLRELTKPKERACQESQTENVTTPSGQFVD